MKFLVLIIAFFIVLSVTDSFKGKKTIEKKLFKVNVAYLKIFKSDLLIYRFFFFFLGKPLSEQILLEAKAAECEPLMIGKLKKF